MHRLPLFSRFLDIGFRVEISLYEETCTQMYKNIQGVPKLTLDILKADSLANLKMIFPQRKCRGTNSFRVIND